jgi:DNA-binding HxlR family transcriptional regulator
VRSYGQYCSLAKALDAVGDRWSLLIVRELWLQGPCRYTDLRNGLPGIATNLLGERLRHLEEVGVVRRQAAAPPVPATLFTLTDSGRELEPVLLALGRWGTRFMVEDPAEASFRAHWLSFPVSEFLRDSAPDGPPVTIVVRTGGESASIRIAGGVVTTASGADEDADLTIDGPPHPVVGLLTGFLAPAEASPLGVVMSGDQSVLDRVRPVHGGLHSAPAAS